MKFSSQLVLATLFLSNLELATGIDKKDGVVDGKARNIVAAAEIPVSRKRKVEEDTTAATAAPKEEDAQSTNTEERELAAPPANAADAEAASGGLESIGEDIALLKLDDQVYWNRFLQRDGSAAPSAMPSTEPTGGDDDDDDDDEPSAMPSAEPTAESGDEPSAMPSSSPTSTYNLYL